MDTQLTVIQLCLPVCRFFVQVLSQNPRFHLSLVKDYVTRQLQADNRCGLGAAGSMVGAACGVQTVLCSALWAVKQQQQLLLLLQLLRLRTAAALNSGVPACCCCVVQEHPGRPGGGGAPESCH